MRIDNWTIIKRDGRIEAFDKAKIRRVVMLCLTQGIGREMAESAPVADRVSSMTVNLLAGTGDTEFHIERVQQAVISQLWADGHYEAAEHYTIYRETRRKAREASRVSPELAALINAEAARFPTDIQAYQFYSKFARWREQEGRRETWSECNDRVFDWFGTLDCWSKLSESEVSWLRQMMFDFKSSPAMRVVQMAGPALERDNLGLYNCAGLPIVDLGCFSELLYVLMQGCGCGFSVESEFIDELPRVKKQRGKDDKTVWHIPDTTEGWCDALFAGLTAWFSGNDIEFDYSKIRPKGSKLKTKGGRSSGPEPLRELLDFARDMILAAQGRQLTDLECHDLCCKIGRIVQVGGVRRAACISLSDLNSKMMREAKHGSWWQVAPHRSMSNNSSVYEFDGLPPVELFVEEFYSIIKSKSGERGIFNRTAAIKRRPKRRKKARFIVNPCQPGFATVLTPEGIRTFDDIDVGSTIWSGQRWTKVTAKVETGIKPVNRYVTAVGSFVGTKEHRVFCNGKRIEVGDTDHIDRSPVPDERESPVAGPFPILGVERLGRMPVYDITVEAEEHSYWTDGLLVSNCAEINFRPYGLCNLSMSIVRGHETEDELHEKVRAATYFGVIQSTATKFRYVRDEWKKNADEERLLGVDIMGHLDHPKLRPGAEGRAELVKRLKATVDQTAMELAARFGINYSAANTCLKPGGDSGVAFASCTLGGYPSQYQIRTTRERADSPIVAMLKDQGVPIEQDQVNPELAVISWPRKNPEGCVTEGSMTAIEQLENWYFWKTTWCEHSASVTIHVKEHEWPAVMAWCYDEEHFSHLTGVSFLPFDGHTYKQAPNQRLTKEEYEEFESKFPKIDWSRLVIYETDDRTEASSTPACTAGGCTF